MLSGEGLWVMILTKQNNKNKNKNKKQSILILFYMNGQKIENQKS